MHPQCRPTCIQAMQHPYFQKSEIIQILKKKQESNRLLSTNSSSEVLRFALK